jgi:hypothetical protein
MNINPEFNKVFKKFEFIESLIVNNVVGRNKYSDDAELKNLVFLSSNIKELILSSTPINDVIL